MASKSFHFHPIFFAFLLFSLVSFSLSHAHLSDSRDNHSSHLDFLKKITGARKGNKPINGLDWLKKHLAYLGYLKNSKNVANENEDVFDEELELAIKRYQKFFNLETTGILDHKTVEQLGSPRCGVPDLYFDQNSTSASTYTFFKNKPRWPENKIANLSYSFPPGTREDAKGPIFTATHTWAFASRLNFHYIENYKQADIKISFEPRYHGDGKPFDGRGGILAHAFAPTDGRMHFDNEEVWSAEARPGAFDIQSVGLHELGHIIGLGHTNNPNDIMYPTIGVGTRKGLGLDDVNGVDALYPRKKLYE